MASKFKSRFWTYARVDGKITFSWDWPPTPSPDSDRYRGYTLFGPEPVELPKEPLTVEEFRAWRDSYLFRGYGQDFSTTSPSDPPIEEMPDYQDAAAFADTVSAIRLEGNTVVVEVTNSSPVPIQMFGVDWRYENETPQPTKGTSIESFEMAGSFTAFRPKNAVPFDHTLAPGASKEFELIERHLPTIRAYIAALSPERYWVSMRSGDHEIGRIDGSEVAEVIDRLDEK